MFQNLHGANRKEFVFKRLVDREALLAPYIRKGAFIRVELN